MALVSRGYRKSLVAGSVLLFGALASTLALSQPKPKTGCGALPDHSRLRAVLQAIVKTGKQKTTGMGNQRWAAIVNRDGVVCAVVYSGDTRSDQWPGSHGNSASGYGHPSCKGGVPSDDTIRKLPDTDPLAHKPINQG